MTAIPRKRALMRRPHWLVKPESIRRLWQIFAGVLAATVVAQLFVPVHPHFGVDGLFAFSAAYGFITCVAMVVFAKVLGWWVKRDDDYYPEQPFFLWTVAMEPAPEPPRVEDEEYTEEDTEEYGEEYEEEDEERV